MKIWLNHRLCDAREATVSVWDHGFLYGDGIYETVHAYAGKIFRWPDHLRRLQRSAHRLELACPWSGAVLLKRIQAVLKANRLPEASIRITITRGPGPLGLDPGLCPQPTLAILPHLARDLDPVWRKGISIGIVSVRRIPPESLDPQIKSNNALNMILAKMEAKRWGVFEAILLNHQGFLTEGTISNIFFLKKGRLYTPALSCGLLEGVTRNVILEVAHEAGFPVQTGRYLPSELGTADECFLSSTTLEIAPVISFKFVGSARTHRIGSGHPGPLTRRLHALFREHLRKELAF